MAPMPELTLEEVIADIRDGETTITISHHGSPRWVVQFDRAWSLAPLVLDRAAADAAADEAQAAGRPWMPEMQWRFMRPGEPLFSTAGMDDFIQQLTAWWIANR